MNMRLRSYFVTLLVLTGFPSLSWGQLILYDDFNNPAHLLNPAKWYGQHFGNIFMEASRRIDLGKLRLAARVYGDTGSNNGASSPGFGVSFPNQNIVVAIQAQVEVVDFNATPCTANTNNETEARIELAGAFFNAGAVPPPSGNSTNDVHARIFMVRRASDGPNVVRIEGEVLRCSTSSCFPFSFFQRKSLGTVLTCPGRICPSQTLLIQWEANNNLFRFRRGTGATATEQTITYTFPDAQLPGSPFKQVGLNPIVENCTAARQQGSMDVLIDNVSVDMTP